jgi:hypothetical protein
MLFITSLAAAQASKGGTMYVAIKILALKSSTGFFAGTNATLTYEDRVTVLQISGEYAEVRSVSNSSNYSTVSSQLKQTALLRYYW